ncbi:MAG: glycosyltransferase [Duncaniella sp.]|nr:glycosyltransferase [Duncaniella sp.]
MATLVLLTASYPLGGVAEPSFVGPEIEALASEFDRVIVAPMLDRGPQLPLPANVCLDRSLLRRPSALDKARSLFRPETWRRLYEDRRYIHSPGKFRNALAFTAYVFYCRRVLRRLIERYSLDLGDTLFYTFWFDCQVASLSGIDGAKTITRAHGYDVYDERNNFLSHSWRRSSLARLAACFAVSDDGVRYMRGDYPQFASKIQLRLLGSAENTRLNPPASDGAVTFVSVARVSPEKRVWLLAECLVYWAGLDPARRVRWIHVGDGPDMERVRRCVASAPENLEVELLGSLPNAEVHELFATRHADFSALLSLSERLPIAACESLSYGVPMVAASVGGLPEIITDEVGVPLSPDPSPEEFARRMDEALPRLGQLREAARRRWEESYNARPLRLAFAREIRRLLQ